MMDMVNVIITPEATSAHVNRDTLEMEQFALVRTM